MLPDGCIDIIFTFNGENGSGKSQHRNPELVGTITTCLVLRYTEKVDMLGIRFKPAAIRAFTRMPLNEITNENVELLLADTLFGKYAFEALHEKNSAQDKISYINDYLIYSLKSALDLDMRIIFAVNSINRYRGSIDISRLAEDVCLSQRQLERRFKSEVGISPKTFSRIVKFKNAVELLQSQPKQDLYSAASATGYYDYSHLIKEFKALSGLSPLAYM